MSFTIFISLILSLIFGNLFMIFFSKYKSEFNKNNQIQDTHEGIVSRHGGLVILIGFIIYSVFYQNLHDLKFLIIILICLIPTIIEDFGFYVSPMVRFILTLITSFLLVSQIENLPDFDIEFLDILLSNKYFLIIFFSLSLTGVINGQNLIDGTNGLSSFTSLIVFCNLTYLSILVNDTIAFEKSLFFIISLLVFILFNYPFGKIFLGDTGSYFLGLISGLYVIEIFGNHPELPSWNAVIILFYPAFEVIFSFSRKLFHKFSPFLPDRKHLHLRLFFILSNGKLIDRPSNALVAPLLSIVWLSPLAIIPLSIKLEIFSFLPVIFQIIVYLVLYLFLSKHNYQKKGHS